MNRFILAYWAAFILALGAAYGGLLAYRQMAAPAPAAQSAAPVAPLGEFELVDRNGETFHSEEFDGQVWIGSFFFTSCPGSCLKMNQELMTLAKEFPEVRLLSLSCDPENDTPQVLKSYAERFEADPQQWRMVTGDWDLLQQIGGQKLLLTVEHQTHSDRVVLVDRAGNVRGRYRATVPAELERLKRELPSLLAETVEEAAEHAPETAPAPSGPDELHGV